MVQQDIPGFGLVQIEHLVLDMNGTLTVHGELLPGVAERLCALSQHLQVHILTADTYGVAQQVFQGLPVSLTILRTSEEDVAKEMLVVALGASQTAAIGNGRNDARMLACARVGIAVIEGEGCAVAAALAADILTRNITEALDLFLHPLRLKATLRS